MSKQVIAKQYESGREYDQAKREQRKQHRQLRDQRKTRKSVWQTTEE